MRFNKKIKIVVPVLIIVGIILISRLSGSSGFVVETAPPLYCDIERGISINGKVQPVLSVSISPEVSGEIVSVGHKEGDAVRQGDTIIKIKPDLYISLVERAEAALGAASAQVSLQEVEAELCSGALERTRQLFNSGAASQEELERCDSEYRIASARLNSSQCEVLSARASLKEANENLLKTSIISPIAGIVTRLNVEEGERVVGTSQMAGTELFTVSDMGRMEIIAAVNENDISKIGLNDAVRIEIDAFPDELFSGRVSKIANSSKNIGTNIEQVSTFEVRIAIDPPDKSRENGKTHILPGMSASGSIIIEKKKMVKTVPVNSVFSKDGKDYVWITEKDGTVKSLQVSCGIRDLSKVEIITGIGDGDAVVTAPYSAITKLTEGVKVTINNE